MKNHTYRCLTKPTPLEIASCTFHMHATSITLKKIIYLIYFHHQYYFYKLLTSVGVRHLGQGLVITLIVKMEDFWSCHLALETLSLSSAENPHRDSSGSSHSPKWNPFKHCLQKTKLQFWHLIFLSSGSSRRIPVPHSGIGQMTPPLFSTNSSLANLWYLS